MSEAQWHLHTHWNELLFRAEDTQAVPPGDRARTNRQASKAGRASPASRGRRLSKHCKAAIMTSPPSPAHITFVNGKDISKSISAGHKSEYAASGVQGIVKMPIVRRVVQNMEFLKVSRRICLTFFELNRKRIFKVCFKWNVIR